MKVAIITEGFDGTGYGHLTRCLSIYRAFEEKAITPVFIANCDDNAKSYLPDVNLVQLNWLENENELLAVINNFDLGIIDSYLAPYELYDKISKAVNKAVYIDDYLRLHYPPGIIINGTIGAENFPYRKDKNQVYLLGIDYMPLRKEFWEVNKRDNIKSALKEILITLGGQDIRNLTFPILEFLLNKYPEFNYHILISKKNYDKFGQPFNFTNIKYYHNLNAEEMLNLICSCNLAITSASQTTYELARIGLPTIAIGLADNQKFNLQGWKREGFIINEIWFSRKNFLQLLLQDLKLLLEKPYTNKSYCDGQGARRIVSEILFGSNSDNFILRKFNSGDVKTIFELSNDEEIRRFSINSNKIEWNDHLIWFEKSLKNEKAYYLVIEDLNKTLMGQVKFDINKDNAIISISIQKDYRGKGFSVKILERACHNFFLNNQMINIIGAYIEVNNFRSIKSFIKAGFILNCVEIINNKKYYFYILKRSN